MGVEKCQQVLKRADKDRKLSTSVDKCRQLSTKSVNKCPPVSTSVNKD